MRLRSILLLLLLVAASAALATRSGAPTHSCTVDVSYPLEVQVRLQDAVVPGRWLHGEVEIQSDRDVSGVEILLTADTGVELAGGRKASWSALIGGTPRVLGFDLRLQDTAEPRQVRVLVRGDAAGLRLERGSALQMLPRGRRTPPLTSEARSGTRTVLEYRGAARSEP